MEHPLDQTFRRRLLEDIRSSSLDTCYRWSAAHRWMQRSVSEPGEWYSDREYPYVKDILNSRATQNWVMKGAQTGLTEIGINRSFFETCYFGRDVLYLLPTDKVATLLSKTRLQNAISLSPYLSERMTDLVDVKRFGTASMFIRGANGDINLKSTPVDRLVMDEIDEMTQRQIELALERLSGAKDPMVYGMSTPTFPQVGIHALFLTGTQEHFYFDCPHCRKRIELLSEPDTWQDSFVVKGAEVTDPECAQSYLQCYSCKGVLPHEHKPKWLRAGVWFPTAVDANKQIRSFQLSQLYSPRVTPWAFAMSYHRGRGDEESRRQFHNSKLGQPYVEDGSQVLDTHITKCCKDYAMDDDLPSVGNTDTITLGIDQGAFHHWSVVKWKLSLGLAGDPNDRATGKLLAYGRVPLEDWDGLYALMARYQVKACVIDFFPDPTAARKFARKFRGFVWLCQYVTGRAAKEIIITEDEYGANIAKVDKASWLSRSLGRVINKGISFPRNISLEFRKQLKGQVREYVRGVDGNYQADWKRISDDHWGHSLNYNEIALCIRRPSIYETNIITSIR